MFHYEKGIIANNFELLYAAFDQQLVVSDFSSFQGTNFSFDIHHFHDVSWWGDIRHLFSLCKDNTAGSITDYTSFLRRANPGIYYQLYNCSLIRVFVNIVNICKYRQRALGSCNLFNRWSKNWTRRPHDYVHNARPVYQMYIEIKS